MRNGKRLSILIMTLGLVLAGCGNGGKKDAAAPELLEPIGVAENTIEVEKQDFYSAVYIDVSVVPQTEELYFTMDGEILDIEVNEGQIVKKGDVLAKVDQTRLNESIKELQETIAYEENIYSMRLTQADLDVQIAEAKLAKLQQEYDEQEQKKAEEEAKKKAEAEAAAREAARNISIVESVGLKLSEVNLLQTSDPASGTGESSAAGENSSAGESSEPGESSSTGESSEPGESSGTGESSEPGESSGTGESSEPGESSGTGESSDTGESSSTDESSGTGESSGVVDDSDESSDTPGDSEQPGEDQESSNVSGDAGSGEESSGTQQPDKPEQPDEDVQQPETGITKYDLQQARLAVQEAELAYDQLKDDYNQDLSQRQSEMQSLLDKVGEDTITASFSGRVVKINVSVGDYVRQYDTVMLLVNEEVKLLRGDKFSNAMLSRASNLDVVIDGQTYGAEYIPYDEDEYLRKSMNGEPLPSWFALEENDEVTFGESGTVRMYRDYSEDTLVVPSSCVQTDDLGDYVYKAENGQRIKTYVTIGIRTSSFAEILDGLNEGDEVYGTE